MRRSRMYLVVALSLCMPASLLGAVEAATVQRIVLEPGR